MFLCRGAVISRSKALRIFTSDKQEACPGNDENRNAPIGCFYTKDKQEDCPGYVENRNASIGCFFTKDDLMIHQ
jgi:hypothetical protein